MGQVVEFKLPDVGEGLSEAEIVEWKVSPGDSVKPDQVLVEVQTDKAVVEIPSPYEGTVKDLGGKVGDVLPVGSTLVLIDTGAEVAARAGAPESAAAHAAAESARSEKRAASTATPTREAPSSPAPPSAPAPTAASGPAPAVAGRRALAAPAVRHLAVELGIDLQTVAGTGPGGRVTRGDVEAATAAPPPATVPAADGGRAAPAAPPRPAKALVEESVPLRGVRRAVAKTMMQAWQEIPHIGDWREIDATELVRARSSIKSVLEPRGLRMTYLPFFIRACAAALRRHPIFNASLDMAKETINYHSSVNIGLAVATEEGLIVPVVHDADRKSLVELLQEAESLADGARKRTLKPEQMAQGTFTISNYGSYGARIGSPIIKPPEVASGGFGRMYDAVVAVGGAPAVRPTLPLVVRADHRIIDGEALGMFLGTLTAYLGDPVLLLAEGF